MKNKIIQAHHKSIWSKDYQISTYNPNICKQTQEIVKSNSTVCSKFTKKVTWTSLINDSFIIKKKLPGIYC